MARRIGSRSREAERRIQDALQARLSVSMERAMTKAITKDSLAAIEQLQQGQGIHIQGAETGRIIVAGWETTARVFGERMMDQIGKRHGSMERKALISDLFRAAFLEFTRSWLAKRITQINRTTEDQLREIVTHGTQQGMSINEISKLIRERVPHMSSLRGHVIARTETHTAANWANQTSAEQSGIDMHKEWCSGSDARVRETHMEADGQTVPLKGAFDVGGEMLEYPGDPSGAADEIINCRCTSLFIEV